MDSVKGKETAQPLDEDSRARKARGLILLLNVGLSAIKAATKRRDAYMYISCVAGMLASRQRGKQEDIYLENVYDRKSSATRNLLSDHSSGWCACPISFRPHTCPRMGTT